MNCLSQVKASDKSNFEVTVDVYKRQVYRAATRGGSNLCCRTMQGGVCQNDIKVLMYWISASTKNNSQYNELAKNTVASTRRN